MDFEKLKKEFLESVEKHEMKIKHETGYNRDIIFENPESCNQWFGLTTWYNHICIYGDMGTYVFARTDDMFGFFGRGDKLEINSGYWSEKLQSDSMFTSHKKFSFDSFSENVKSSFEAWWEDEPEEEKQECWKKIDTDVLYESDNPHEHEHLANVEDFSFVLKNGDTFHFQDFWEHDNNEYTYQYMGYF